MKILTFSNYGLNQDVFTQLKLSPRKIGKCRIHGIRWSYIILTDAEFMVLSMLFNTPGKPSSCLQLFANSYTRLFNESYYILDRDVDVLTAMKSL